MATPETLVKRPAQQRAFLAFRATIDKAASFNRRSSMSRGYCSHYSRRNWPYIDFDRLDRFALLAAQLPESAL